MTDTDIKRVIDGLNSNKPPFKIFLRPLSENVVLGKLWHKEVTPTSTISRPHGPASIYLIKNDDDKFVAAVLDMVQDLHWYVIPGERKKGYLTKALKKTILYHLAQEREEQKISIDVGMIGENNFQASEKVALNLGFEKIIDSYCSEYSLSLEDYETNEYISGKNTPMPKERMEELKKLMNFYSRQIWIIQSEIEMKFGDWDYSEELYELKDEIEKHITRVEDAWYRSKQYKNNTSS